MHRTRRADAQPSADDLTKIEADDPTFSLDPACRLGISGNVVREHRSRWLCIRDRSACNGEPKSKTLARCRARQSCGRVSDRSCSRRRGFSCQWATSFQSDAKFISQKLYRFWIAQLTHYVLVREQAAGPFSFCNRNGLIPIDTYNILAFDTSSPARAMPV